MSNNPIAINPDQRSTLLAKKSSGWDKEEVDFAEFNEAIFRSVTDRVWGYQSQVISNDATFYTDVSGNPLDKNDVAVVIDDDDKILIGHDIAATANQTLKCGSKKVTIEMLQGVTWDLSTFDLMLGESGDSFRGSVSIAGTGQATIYNPLGMLVINSGLEIIKIGGWFSLASILDVSNIIVNGASPSIFIKESDGITTHNQTKLSQEGNVFYRQTYNDTGSFVANDYSVSKNAAGPLTHNWYVSGSSKMQLTGTDITVHGASISPAQLGYLGALDQALATTDTVEFTRLGVGTGNPVKTVDIRGEFPLFLKRNDVTDKAWAINLGTISSDLSFKGRLDNGNQDLVSPVLLLQRATGHIGFGTDDPLSKVEIEDNGTVANGGALLRLTQDDSNIVGLVVANTSFSTAETEGFGIYVTNGGSSNVWARGAGSVMTIGTDSTPAISIDTNQNVQFNAYIAAGIAQFYASGNISSGPLVNPSITGNLTVDDFVFATDLDATNSLGIGLSGIASVGMDIISPSGELLFGNTEDDATDKNVRMYSRQWDSAEPGFTMLYTLGDSVDNDLNIGGGTAFANSATDIYFYTGADNKTLTGTYKMHIDGSGNVDFTNKVFINDTTNGNMTYGLTINQGSEDNEILTFKSSDVAHGVTGDTETDTYGYIKKANTNFGGVRLYGYTEDEIALQIGGVATVQDTTNIFSSHGVIDIKAFIKTGTSKTSLSSNANLLTIRNSDTGVWLVKGDGEVYTSILTRQQLDEYDDILLTRAAGAMLSRDADKYREMHPETVKQLQELGIANEEGSLYSQQGVLALNLGTDGQLFNITKSLLNIVTSLAERFNISSSELFKMSLKSCNNKDILKMAKNYAA